MYQKLRSVHLCTALFCLAVLCVYGASGLRMAHRRWFAREEQVSRQLVRLPAGIADARLAARELALGGELSDIQIVDGGLRFRVARPGSVSVVEYSARDGSALVTTTSPGFWGSLNRLHQAKGLGHDYLPLTVWIGLIGTVSLGLLLLGATGIYLWFRDRRERWIGGVLLAAGSGLAAVLIGWMRLG